MKKLHLILITLFVATSFQSCDKYLEGYSPNLVTVRQLSDLDEVLIGSVYVPSRKLTLVTSNSLANWLNYIDDDVNTVIGQSASIHPLDPMVTTAQMGFMFGYTTWQYDVAKSYDETTTYRESDTWNDLYKRINVINIILNEIEELTNIREADRPDYYRVKAEAQFLRAQFYFLLVNIYAKPYSPKDADITPGVPLKLTHYVEHQPHQDIQFERTPVAQVYNQIIADLESSIKDFESASVRTTHLRANANAAKTLLSRVYLFMEKYEESKKYSEQVIREKNILEYIAEDNPDYIFLSVDNPEILFSQGSLNFQTAFSGAPMDFCVTADLANLYDEKDKRLNTFFKTTQYSDSLVLNRKYRSGIHESHVSDQFLIRVSEAYLNLAEASCMLGDEATANTYLNLLKKYRITDHVDQNLSGQDLITEIRDERRRELCFEGHRWFDLRRYSVNSKYPYSKSIVRSFGVYTNNGYFIRMEEYILEKNDPAYTLQIPSDVREFQPAMPINERVVRKPNRIVNIKF